MRAHVLSYAVGRGAGLVAQVAAVVVLSGFGGDLYLSYSLVLAATLFSTNLAVGWYRQALLRDAGEATSPSRPPRGVMLAILISGVLTALVAGWLVAMDSAGYAAATVFGASYAMQVVLVSEAQRRLRPWRSVAIEAARLGTTALAPALLHVAGARIELPTVLLCASLPSLAMYVRAGLTGGPRARRDVRADLAFGMPMAVWLAMTSVLLFSDRFVLQLRVGVEEAAAYATTYDLVARGASALLMPILLAAHPLIMAEQNSSGSGAARALIRRTLAWTLIGGLVVLVAALAVSAVGSRVVPAADSSLPVVVALAMAGVAWQLAMLVHKEFELRRQTWPLLGALTVAVAVSLAVNWAVAPQMGNAGVALTNLGAVILYMTLVGLAQSALRRQQPVDA